MSDEIDDAFLELEIRSAGISCRQAIDRLLEMSKNMQRQHLTVLKGGAA